MTLETHFNDIHQRHMQDTPLCNPALRVQSIGFCRHRDQVLGIVLTPWFMNLISTPLPGNDFPSAPMGERRVLPLASGNVDFFIGEIPGFGRLDTCALFSPVFDFQTHDQAVTAAQTILGNLFGVPAASPPPKAAVSRRALLRGMFGRSP